MFGEVGWLATVSTSSAIRDKQTQVWLKPPEGMHVYALVTGDVARWRELAKVRLWLAGYGYVKLSSPNRHTGVCNILERALIDLTVFSPERLDYVAGAQIPKSAPFRQDRPAPELHPGLLLDLDRLPDVTEEERQACAAVVAEARARVEPEQRRLIRAHITSGPLALPDAVVEDEITARLDLAEHGELDATQPLYFDNGTTRTAGALSKAQDGKRLRDPLEPDYGPSQSVFHWNSGNWLIVSWAHGIRRVYRLAPTDHEPPPPDEGDMDDLLARVELAEEPAQERKSRATAMIELAAGLELWHTPGADGEAYATIQVAQQREIWPLKTKGFRAWLTHQFYQKHESNPSAQAVQDALLVLGGKALFAGLEYPVYTRLAECDGKIYLDLANDAWQAVEIDATGWRVVTDPPVKFRRARGMLPLPEPMRVGTLDQLRTAVNVASDDDWMLLVAWLVAALRPHGPYPVLVLHGEQGSAKSTTARILRALVDPSTALLRAEPRDARDLMIAGTNGWVVSLDNLSHIQPWLSDALCRLATGGGFSTRELYSDAEEMIFDAQRPVILNGIEELATRGDLLDRAIILYLPTIPKAQRRPETVMWRDFERTRPLILGALLDAVSTALATVETVKLAELLHELHEQADERTRKAQGWPTNGRAVSNALRRVAPNLRQVGVDVTFSRQSRTGKRQISLASESMRTSSSPSSPSSPSAKNDREANRLSGDASGDANLSGDANPLSGDATLACGDVNGLPGDDGVTQTRILANPCPVSPVTQDDDGDAKKPMYSHHPTEEEETKWTA